MIINVVKIGGNVIDDPSALDAFLDDFTHLPFPRILIHGGGKEATRLSARLDIPTTMIDGRRVTDQATLDVVTMVYAGLINKRIVAQLQAKGCNALGLTGADACSIPATRRPANPVDFGFVGDIDASKVNDKFIASLLDAGITPVFCAIAHDGHGTLLNCNADSVASAVAIAASRIAPTVMHYCFEKDGVMRDIDDPTSVIPEITKETYVRLRNQGIINKGMIPKIDNAFSAISQGVGSVIIKNSRGLLDDKGSHIRP